MSTAGPKPVFDVKYEGETSRKLVIGLSELGVAGVTAVDYLAKHLDLQKEGHITAEGLPSITPFEEGRPRHHTRLFSHDDLDFTVLIGELFIPLWSADAFSDSIMDWVSESNVEEIVFLSGVPIPHAPNEHKVFFVATDDYRDKRLTEEDIDPMGGGFLEGVNANLVARGIDSPVSVGVYTTPVHVPGPDVDSAIRLLNAFSKVHDIQIDTDPLESYAEEVRKYYEQLAESLNNMEQQSGTRDFPDDRTFV